MTAEDDADTWKPAPAAPRFEVRFGPDYRPPGEPNRPLRPKGFSMIYRFDVPEGDSDAVNERTSMSWQFIALHQRSGYDLRQIETTINRVIPEPDNETTVLAYTEGEYTILVFSPKAVNLTWVLLQARGPRDCEKPNPGHADRLVLGDPAEWGPMVKTPEKRR